MAGETKFTEEEVKSLKELQDSYMKVQKTWIDKMLKLRMNLLIYR
jgi:hypothetical protein